MSYVAITAKIKQLLTEITDITVLYDYVPDVLESYPAVTIQAQGHKNRFNDTASNIRSYQYLIRVYAMLTDNANAEASVQSISDQVIARLEANVVVTNVWDKALPTEAVYRTGAREIPVLAAEITAVFEKRVNRNV